MEKDLKYKFLEFVLEANKHSLVRFCFMYNGDMYYAEWRKGKWVDPVKIDFFGDSQ